MKPFSESCEENKSVILEQLHSLFIDRQRIIEIGSGTGQHAVHFARHIPHLSWQTSELAPNLHGIAAWQSEAALANLPPPIALDVVAPWPAIGKYDGAFTANTLHIMPWSAVIALFSALPRHLHADAIFVIYGPFHYHGVATSESNLRFDQWLKTRDAQSGVRDIADLQPLAEQNQFELVQDIAMPVNNRLLVWRYTPQLA
jgi:hypothetical protein